MLLCITILWCTPAGKSNTGNQDRSHALGQTTRLAALAKVWGILKYYHPKVATGELDWDKALIEEIPHVIAGGTFDTLNNSLNRLITRAGNVDANTGSTYIIPALFKWIEDQNIFNGEVRAKLKTLLEMHVPAANFYVQIDPIEFQTTYENENPYDEYNFAGEDYRLLALFRFWNVIQYFFPYKEDMDREWGPVLEEFIPRVIAASTEEEYHLALLEMSTRLNDGHANCTSSVLTSYFGSYYAPAEALYVEGKTIISRVSSLLMSPGGLQVGDIILKCRDTPIGTFRQDIRKYMGGSNEPYINRKISRYALRGKDSHLTFTISRNGESMEVTIIGHRYITIFSEFQREDLKRGKWKILPGNIGYINMDFLEKADIAPALAELHETKAIIFDIRSYPAFILYDLSPYLNPGPREFVIFAIPDLDYPGNFRWSEPYLCSKEDNPGYYKGRVVILGDERSLSLSEFTMMALQTAPDATIIGSQSAGADGDVSKIRLPGSIRATFTGLGVYYPDGTATQRIGIVPDIEVRPTIAGIQAGRDEVLERAIHFIENNR